MQQTATRTLNLPRLRILDITSKDTWALTYAVRKLSSRNDLISAALVAGDHLTLRHVDQEVIQLQEQLHSLIELPSWGVYFTDWWLCA